jgi:hypothetical protein
MYEQRVPGIGLLVDCPFGVYSQARVCQPSVSKGGLSQVRKEARARPPKDPMTAV